MHYVYSVMAQNRLKCSAISKNTPSQTEIRETSNAKDKRRMAMVMERGTRFTNNRHYNAV